MATTFTHPLNNPLLREIERLSPAEDLTLPVGYDSDGWSVYECFVVGDIVVSRHNGLAYRVQGFTLDNLLLLKPHGLGHCETTLLVFGIAEGFPHPPREETWRHPQGLVEFG